MPKKSSTPMPVKRLSPRVQGNLSEAKALAALLSAGYTVLMPWGGGERYDFVVDRGNGKFQRIQSKTGRIRNGGIVFNTCSNQAHSGGGRTAYTGQIEAFAVYCPDNDKTYLVPIKDVATGNEAKMRLDPPLYNYKTNLRYAQPYEVKVKQP